MFPNDAWYAAAWDREVGRELLPRTICGRAIVLYRRLDGEPAALADACWHRLVPLSIGSLHGDEVMCGYHGIRYDATGRCTFMPSQETVNPGASVASFPVVSRHRLVWVWLGDPAKADPARIPALPWTDDPEWTGDGETIHVACDYRLVLDNLMDLTHETFVHGTSIGNDAVAEAPFTVSHTDDTVTVTRWMYGIEPPPAWQEEMQRRFPGYSGPVDRWQIITWTWPSTIVIDVGVAKAGTGAPEGDRSQGVRGYVLDMITPENDRRSHYFWLRMRDYDLDDHEYTAVQRRAVAGIFAEDTAMLEAQQRAIEAHPDYDFYNLNIDAGSMWVRRLLDRSITAEAEVVGQRAGT